MNRDIRFRAWHKDTKVMAYEWDEHSLTSDVLAHKLSRPSSTSDLVKKHRNKIIFLQYTGLKDKNGKEIYEGDICRNDDGEVCEVRYWSENGYPAFDITDWGGDENGLSYYQANGGLEVIGNIYENPDLLSETKPTPKQQGDIE